MAENILNKNQKAILGILLGTIFLISLFYSFYFRIQPSIDARAYDNIAWNIVQGNGYRELADVPFEKDNSIVRVGPGYEFFLAGIYYIFGHHYEIIWIIHALLITLSALIIFLLTREIFRGDWSYFLGLCAAGLIGFSPDLITIQGMLMAETLGVFLIILTTYLFFKYFNQEHKSWQMAFLIGVFLGASILVRTPAAFLLMPITALFLINRPRTFPEHSVACCENKEAQTKSFLQRLMSYRKVRGKNWKHLFVLFAAMVIVFTPWIVRNFNVYNTFVLTNLAYGLNLASGNHPGATGELEPYEINDLYLKEYGIIEGNKRLSEETLKFIISNPLEFIKLTLYRISIYFSFSRPTGFWFHLGGLSKALTLLFSSIYSVLLFVFGFFGIVKMRDLGKEGKRRLKFLLAMLVMMPLAVIGIIVETRYRFLAYPFFAIFAGFGLRELINRRIHWKLMLWVILLLFLNTGFDVARNWSRIIERINNL